MGKFSSRWNELSEIIHKGKPENPVGVTVVYGGQAGSEGKGAIAGWLARRYIWGAAVCNFMPNAGHTWVSGDEIVVVNQLPIGLVGEHVGWLMIGASSVLNLDRLFEEIDRYNVMYNVSARLRIHPRAQIMLGEYIDWETENLRYIASTAKGCGAAIAAKARREQGVRLAADVPELSPFVDPDFDETINDLVNDGGAVLVEQAQGFDLDINHGVSYPFCTSRQTTPTQICADLGLSERLVTSSIAVIRTHPIRVGDVEGGTSGGYGSKEIDWAQVSRSADRQVQEVTTVTKRVRRVFEFDFQQIKHMSRICRPTTVALTFADYLDPDIFQLTQERYREAKLPFTSISEPVASFIFKLEQALGRATYLPRVQILKTGPDDAHTLNLGYVH